MILALSSRDVKTNWSMSMSTSMMSSRSLPARFRRRAPLKSKDVEELPMSELIARCQEIAAVFRRVTGMLAENNLGTFGQMITGAVRLLETDPAALARARKNARFILIDEFQDSNVAQIRLAKLLAGEEENVFAVGDPDQAIYRFRGATAGAFQHFQRHFA